MRYNRAFLSQAGSIVSPEHSFNDALRAIPLPLQERVQRQWQHLRETAPGMALPTALLAELARVWACAIPGCYRICPAAVIWRAATRRATTGGS